MGADCFESNEEMIKNAKKGIPKIGIGNGVKLINVRNVTDEETDSNVIKDNIIVIPINSIIPDGMVIYSSYHLYIAFYSPF